MESEIGPAQQANGADAPDGLVRSCHRGARLPDGVVLFITLSKALDDMHNRVGALPWFFDRKPEYRSYKFMVPGLTFHMFFGMQIRVPQRRICSARHGFLYMTDEGDAAKLQTMAVMAQQSERKGKLWNEAAPDRLDRPQR